MLKFKFYPIKIAPWILAIKWQNFAQIQFQLKFSFRIRLSMSDYKISCRITESRKNLEITGKILFKFDFSSNLLCFNS